MKVITLEIDDERYEDFKSFKQLYAAHIVSKVSRPHIHEQSASSSSQKKIAWHDITLEHLEANRPDLLRAIFEVRGSWAAAVYDAVGAIEAGQPLVRLKQETTKEWMIRNKLEKPKDAGGGMLWLLLIIVFVFALWLICR